MFGLLIIILIIIIISMGKKNYKEASKKLLIRLMHWIAILCLAFVGIAFVAMGDPAGKMEPLEFIIMSAITLMPAFLFTFYVSIKSIKSIKDYYKNKKTKIEIDKEHKIINGINIINLLLSVLTIMYLFFVILEPALKK